MIIVYHLKRDCPQSVRRPIVFGYASPRDIMNAFQNPAEPTKHSENYDYVASVNVDDMEDCFDLTNHQHDDWTIGKKITHHAQGPQRSTSVGDVFVTRGGVYAVADSGFTLLKRLSR